MANLTGRYSMSMAMLDPQQARSSHPGASPLYSASVHIGSLIEADSVNPEPWGPEGRRVKGSALRETLNQDYLSPMKLVQLTQEPDLRRVTYLELSINTTGSSVGNFGSHLPNLSQLRFTNSSVPCVRDLGTGLSCLKILWMPRCKLKDLDGLPALQNLQEFYLPFNHVEDISVITMLPALEVLDLESNNVKDEDQLGYLALCPSLRVLTLEGNPLSITLAETAGGESGYRETIHEMVRNIKVLDDRDLQGEFNRECGAADAVTGESLSSHSSLFALSEAGLGKDWHILQQSIKQGGQFVDRAGAGISTSPVSRPMTAPVPRSLPVSPSPPPCATDVDDESSELTHGLNQVICGNPVRALRARKQKGLSSQSVLLSGSSYVPMFQSSYSEQQDGLFLSSVPEDLVTKEERLFSETRQTDRLLLDTADKHSPPLHSSTTPPCPSEKHTHLTPQQLTFLTPTPSDSSLQPIQLTPTPPDYQTSHSFSRRLPTPPSVTDLPPRPKSVTDFRHRRYRKLSADTPRSFAESSTRT